jgi:hypothetical protein
MAKGVVKNPAPQPERWSQTWVARSLVRRATKGPRLAGAIPLLIVVAFYSIELAALLAIPCGFIVWRRIRSLWPDL